MSEIDFQAYGNFLSSVEQIINPNKPIIFEKGHDVRNIEFENDSGYIKILHSGIYIINLFAQFTKACQVVLYINNYPELSTLTSSKSGTINIHQIIKLEKGNEISLHNYDLLFPITTIFYNNKLIPQSKNINFHIYKLSSINTIEESSCDDYFNDSTKLLINQN